MPVGSSPTVKRRRLAAELRRYREELKLTIDEVADQLEWSSAKISRIENARVSVLPRDVKFLLGVYGVGEGDERDLLLGLSRESRKKGWWHEYGVAIPEGFQVYVGLEAEAATIRNYTAELIPGFLQTEDYARTVHGAWPKEPVDEVERQVALRLARQEMLVSPDAPEVLVVINEAVIRRVVGGHQVMRAQLLHLIEVGERPNFSVQVLPFDLGAHPSMDGSFIILDFPDPADPDVVYIEYHSGTLYLEKAAEVQHYGMIFDHLRGEALSAAESSALISKTADELT